MNREARSLNDQADTRTFIYNTFHRAEIATGRGQAAEARKLYEELLTDTTTPLLWHGTFTPSSGVSVRAPGISMPRRDITGPRSMSSSRLALSS
jgi:hypothetical protein